MSIRNPLNVIQLRIMSQAAANAPFKIDLQDGLSLWLASSQQQAAARFVVNEIFTKDRYNHPGFKIAPTDSVVDTASVKTLQRILDENGVDRVNYLKCDCEGGEYEIFRSLDDATFARIDKIAMEFHEYSPEQNRQELIDILQKHGFKVQVEKSW